MGFDHNALGVTKEVLEEDYILQIAVLEEVVMSDLENRFIKPFFRVDFSERLPHIDDYRDIPGMVVRPPGNPALFCPCKVRRSRCFCK